MPFTSKLTVQVLQAEWGGRALARLNAPLEYYDEATDTSFVIPEGFVTDFLSIPWFARWLISPFNEAAKAGALHDWLLYTRVVSKKEAHRVFKRALKDLGVRKLERNIMYWAVHWPFAHEVTQPDASINRTRTPTV